MMLKFKVGDKIKYIGTDISGCLSHDKIYTIENITERGFNFQCDFGTEHCEKWSEIDKFEKICGTQFEKLKEKDNVYRRNY